jgi:hypothetical protein
MPKIHYDYKTTTDGKGRFVFERVVPGDGQVARVAGTQLGGGMSRWTPTHVTKATFAPGQTMRVVIGRDGRQVLGRLVPPATMKSSIDWRLAMLSLQSQPKNVPPIPKPPFPPGVDPQKDQDAVQVWWEQFRVTDEGKKFQEAMKRYSDAVNSFKPDNYSAQVQPDGAFAFEDLPAGNYRLTIQAFDASPGHPGMHGDLAATLEHSFEVPEAQGGDSSRVINLGELTLKPLENRGVQP